MLSYWHFCLFFHVFFLWLPLNDKPTIFLLSLVTQTYCFGVHFHLRAYIVSDKMKWWKNAKATSWTNSICIWRVERSWNENDVWCLYVLCTQKRIYPQNINLHYLRLLYLLFDGTFFFFTFSIYWQHKKERELMFKVEKNVTTDSSKATAKMVLAYDRGDRIVMCIKIIMYRGLEWWKAWNWNAHIPCTQLTIVCEGKMKKRKKITDRKLQNRLGKKHII